MANKPVIILRRNNSTDLKLLKNVKQFDSYTNLILTKQTDNQNNITIKAKYLNGDKYTEITSKNIESLLGKDNLRCLYEAIATIQDETVRTRALLTLLTPEVEERMPKIKKRVRKIIKPYVVKDNSMLIRSKRPRVVIEPEILNEDSNHTISQMSESLSIDTNVLLETEANISKCIDNNTQIETMDMTLDEAFDNLPKIKTYDGSIISIPIEPKDKFHLLNPEIMKHLSREEKSKIVRHQAYLDWKYCLEPDCDGNLLIHLAVINKDWDLLKRQCFALKTRGENVNITAKGLTPLLLAVIHELDAKYLEVLFEFGADPFILDEDGKNILHYAAENDATTMIHLLNCIKKYASKILQTSSHKFNENLLSDESVLNEIGRCEIIKELCVACNHEGYNPLMVASQLGKHENVKILLSHYPYGINDTMPNTGNTSVYLAVSAVTSLTDKNLNSTQVSNYYRTIEILLDFNADVRKPNHQGISLFEMLQNNAFSNINHLISKKIAAKHFDNPLALGFVNENGYMRPIKVPKRKIKGKNSTDFDEVVEMGESSSSNQYGNNSNTLMAMMNCPSSSTENVEKRNFPVGKVSGENVLAGNSENVVRLWHKTSFKQHEATGSVMACVSTEKVDVSTGKQEVPTRKLEIPVGKMDVLKGMNEELARNVIITTNKVILPMGSSEVIGRNTATGAVIKYSSRQVGFITGKEGVTTQKEHILGKTIGKDTLINTVRSNNATVANVSNIPAGKVELPTGKMTEVNPSVDINKRVGKTMINSDNKKIKILSLQTNVLGKDKKSIKPVQKIIVQKSQIDRIKKALQSENNTKTNFDFLFTKIPKK